MKNIEKIFKNHWEFYNSQAVETIKQQSGQIEQVSKDYQGRVLYELLQNAFDKADDKIYIKVDEEYLYIANNGKNFTISEKYSYENGNNNGEKRSDFHALCSISTSNKNINDNFGNKGIGFNSVYSLHNYADIFFKIDNEESFKCFRKYGEIKELNEDFDSIENKDIINKQLKSLQNEYKDRGIPGFYYPILLNEDIDNKEFSSYKTVIRIKHNNKIQELINELETIHFDFVRLKTEKDFTIVLKNNKQQSLNIEVKENPNVIKNIIKKINQDLLEDSKVKKPEVAILYKTDTQFSDYIYNYLPTKVISPFKMVDLNADFLTSLNRENINLKDGDDGKYNKALLQSCIELHFLNISSYLDDKVDLNLKYIEKIDKIDKKVSLEQDHFWKYLLINNDSSIKKESIEIIKNIFNNKWENFAEFIVQLAKKYFNGFDNNLKKENFDDFWKVIFDLLHRFENIKGENTDTYKGKLKETIEQLKTEKVKCIYTKDSAISFNNDIFYKESEKNNIVLPKDIDVKIIDYDFLGLCQLLIKIKILKNFTNYDELLKHFRQISRDGKISEYTITETEQKKILKGAYQIFKEKKNKKEKNYVTTHRYEEVLSTKDNKDYTKISADFAVSTLFLKLKEDKGYKPAQFCFKDELDTEFLKFCTDEQDDFLKFLGVSFDKNIRYVDYDKKFKNIYEKIPAIYEKTEEDNEKINYLKNMQVVYDNIYKHPALFYKTNKYEPILTEIKNIQDKDSLKEVVKKLSDYPKSYIEILKSALDLKQDKDLIFKIYFEMFKKYKKELLIYKNDGSFEWIKNDENFYIAKTKKDFELLKDKVDILATFSDVKEDKELNKKQANIKLSIVSQGEEDSKIKMELEKYIIDILLLISYSELSEHDFLEGDIESLKKFNQDWQDLKLVQVDKIQTKFTLDKKEFEGKLYDKPLKLEKKIYFKEKNDIASFAQAISDFFNVEKLKDSIKLILLGQYESFDKFDKNDISKISQRWIQIDEKTKQDIVRKLRGIGFKNDIEFKMVYTKNDFDCEEDNHKTSDDIQNEIDKLIQNEKFTIVFDVESENKVIIENFKSKYQKILEDYLSNLTDIDEIYLNHIKYICLSDNILKELINKKLNDENIDNLVAIYKNKAIPKAKRGSITSFVAKEINKNELQISSIETDDEQLKESLKQIAKAKSQRGSLAEKIFAKSIFSEQCKNIISRDIDNFIPKSWYKTRKMLSNIKEFEDLRISKTNVKAGYDVVCVEKDTILLCEVKAIDSQNSYLYLTNNELNKLKYHNSLSQNNGLSFENCEWRLIGVDEKQEVWFDLTEHFFNLLYEKDNNEIKEKDYLVKMRENGVYFDSLVFKFTI